jgi:hypothetical protein
VDSARLVDVLWLLNDSQQGIAVVTKMLWTGHNAVEYRYTVNHQEYKGECSRNWREAKVR